MARTIEDAQHEAAHVVVGVALGLRLFSASIGRTIERDGESAGTTVWYPKPWPREADLIMTAAGVAWERHCGDLANASYDLNDLRRAGVKGNARIRVLERAAWALLMSRPEMHARVTRALLEGPFTEADVRAMARARLK